MGRVNGSSLKTVRDFYGESQSAFAKRLSISQSLMSKFEKGEKIMGEDQQKLFSEYFLPQFFQGDIDVASQQLYYRKFATITKKMISQFEARVNLINHYISECMEIIDISLPNLPQVDIEDYGRDFEHIATEIRLKMGLGRGPILDIVKTIEQAGVIIQFFDFSFITGENHKFDGLSFYNNGIPIILINDKIPNSRKVFTMAHELGHLIMHFDRFIGPERDIEKEANEFASAFLAPAKEIKSQLRNLNLQKLFNLKIEWNMSIAALLYRAKFLGNITDQTWRRWMMNVAPFRKSEPNEFEISKPETLKRLIEAVNSATLGSFNSSIGYSQQLIKELFSFEERTRPKFTIV